MVTSGSASSSGTPVPVLLDCDPGIDDALAICDLLARRAAGQIELAGIVVTAGNVCRDDEIRNALGWLALAAEVDSTAGRDPGTDVPIHPGAEQALVRPHVFTPETHGPTGTGYARLPQPRTRPSTSNGVAAWQELSRRYDGELQAIVTGPLSTLAQAVGEDPELPRRLAGLTVMGGSFCGHPGNTTAVAEWNCHVDPEAARQVQRACAAAGVTLRWCGQNVTDFAQITPAQVTEMLTATRGAPITRALAAALRFYFEFHQAMGEGYRAKVHDAAVAALALEPALGRWSPAVVDIACADEATRGMTVAEFRPERWERTANAQVLQAVPGPGGPSALIDAWARRHVDWACGR